MLFWRLVSYGTDLYVGFSFPTWQMVFVPVWFTSICAQWRYRKPIISGHVSCMCNIFVHLWENCVCPSFFPVRRCVQENIAQFTQTSLWERSSFTYELFETIREQSLSITTHFFPIYMWIHVIYSPFFLFQFPTMEFYL